MAKNLRRIGYVRRKQATNKKKRTEKTERKKNPDKERNRKKKTVNRNLIVLLNRNLQKFFTPGAMQGVTPLKSSQCSYSFVFNNKINI